MCVCVCGRLRVCAAEKKDGACTSGSLTPPRTVIKYGRALGSVNAELLQNLSRDTITGAWAYLAHLVGFQFSPEAQDRLREVRIQLVLVLIP